MWLDQTSSLTPNCGIAGPNRASVEHVFSQFKLILEMSQQHALHNKLLD